LPDEARVEVRRSPFGAAIASFVTISQGFEQIYQLFV